MISRRNVIVGLAAAGTAGCSAPPYRQAAVAPNSYYQPAPETPLPEPSPPEATAAPAPPRHTPQGLDAVIDISAHSTVSDFRLVRASNVLAVIHKASEADFYADPKYAERRPQAEAAGLLWGAYHFGKGDASGAQQAAFFLQTARPGPKTLLALDIEPNEGDPSNSMTREQAEEFVEAVARATGKLPLIYAHPSWANGGMGITPNSILARCGLWVVDYRPAPTIPRAWARSGWRLWQYASDNYAGRRARGGNSGVQGVTRFDRNLFNGDAASLHRFWTAAA
jgi:lysozyme